MTIQQSITASNTPEQYRFTLEDYLLLDRSGAFQRYAKTELIEGVIFAVNAQFSKHARVQTLLYRAIATKLDQSSVGLEAWIEISVAFLDGSMPQPDIVVTSDLPPEGPVSANVVSLIVEIADTSLEFDLGKKSLFYAAAGIPEYWVADVNARVIQQRWSPQNDGYAERRQTEFGVRVEAATVEGLTVETTAL